VERKGGLWEKRFRSEEKIGNEYMVDIHWRRREDK